MAEVGGQTLNIQYWLKGKDIMEVPMEGLSKWSLGRRLQVNVIS